MELWPYFDRAVCQTVKDVVEPIMDAYRPVGLIQKIFFQELTFGDAPFRVEGEGQRVIVCFVNLWPVHRSYYFSCWGIKRSYQEDSGKAAYNT